MPAYTYHGRPCEWEQFEDGDLPYVQITLLDTGAHICTLHPSPYILEDLGFPAEE